MNDLGGLTRYRARQARQIVLEEIRYWLASIVLSDPTLRARGWARILREFDRQFPKCEDFNDPR